MKIGLYGLPCAGKSFILNRIDFLKVIEGSATMKRLYPSFDVLDEFGKNEVRKKFAEKLLLESAFIMDGHYSFGDRIAFTESDGTLYDVILYLYIKPEVLRSRMKESEKNNKYVNLDIEEWQIYEITELRKYCHKHNKDFYVIDNTSKGYFEDVNEVISFIKAIYDGYSCVDFAKKCTRYILKNESEQEQIILADGDKTITVKDTSNLIYGYTTHIFDNNFYTGYQAWLHYTNFAKNYSYKEIVNIKDIALMLKLNEAVADKLGKHSYILTSGDDGIWESIAKYLQTTYFCGNQMSADTKYFITKFLREAGKRIVAYGDGMNDYYMLKEADKSYLVAKPDGSISRSIKNMDLGGISIVRVGEDR